jgi:hypothetical protein
MDGADSERAMIVFRVLGYLLALVGFGFLIVDGARSIAAGGIQTTAFGQTWSDIHIQSLGNLQVGIERHLPGWLAFLWDPVMINILIWPTFAVAFALALIFILIGGRGRRRRRRASAWD